MGGSSSTEWLGALGASLDAAEARSEDEAAADLAFSLRQDTTLAEALTRSGSGWSRLVEGEACAAVEEVGADYALAGSVLLRLDGLTVRAAPVPAPRRTDRTFLEVLGAACRAGAVAEVSTRTGTADGVLVRVGADHLALRRGDVEILLALGAVEWVRISGPRCYSVSRGFSG